MLGMSLLMIAPRLPLDCLQHYQDNLHHLGAAAPVPDRNQKQSAIIASLEQAAQVWLQMLACQLAQLDKGHAPLSPFSAHMVLPNRMNEMLHCIAQSLTIQSGALA